MTQDQELQDPLAEVLDGLRGADKRLGVAFGQPGMLAELAAQDCFATPVLCALALASLNGGGLLTPQRHDRWCCVPLPLLPATVECLRCAWSLGFGHLAANLVGRRCTCSQAGGHVMSDFKLQMSFEAASALHRAAVLDVEGFCVIQDTKRVCRMQVCSGWR